MTCSRRNRRTKSSAPAAWEDEGALGAWSRAREILRDHNPRHLDDRQDTEIRRRFTILA